MYAVQTKAGEEDDFRFDSGLYCVSLSFYGRLVTLICPQTRLFWF